MAFDTLTNGTDFVNQLRLYQNANNDARSVKANFVVRTAEFELIMSDIRQKQANDPAQHELLLGRRGSGKSTLLRRIQIEIDEDPALRERYVVVNLAEEQAGIFRLSDLWYETLQEISRQQEEPLALRAFSSFATEQDYTRYLYTQLHDLLAQSGKRAVLLLDNLDRILGSLTDDGHLLREFLLNYQDLQLIGGSTRMNEHFWQYDKPFYEFFRTHRLEALSFSDIHTLLNQWAAALNLPQLHDYALRNRGRIEALRILTDGLPRTLQFFIRVFLQNSTLTGFDHIRQTMDLASPLYQERLEKLTPPQRKIVLEMAFLWEACSTGQLVDVCRMESKLISSYLKQLTDLGLVETVKTRTKNNLYRLSERFFNMWLIMTQGNPDQKRKARYLTIFLETWYDATQIRTLTADHVEKLSQKGMGYDQAVVLSKAYSQSRYITTDQRDQLLTLTRQLPDYDPRIGDLPESYEEIRKRIMQLYEQGEHEEALRVADSIENEEDGVKYFLQGYLYHELREYKKAETLYLQAIGKGNIKALFNLAFLYANQGKADQAETLYLQAIDEGDVNALNNLANLYAKQGKADQSEALYQKAIDKGDVDALNNLALLYTIQDKPDQAEVFYQQAVDKGNVSALYNLAVFYFSRNTEKSTALHLIQQHTQQKTDNLKAQTMQLIIELWDEQFIDVDERAKRLFTQLNNSLGSFFIEYLLWLEQTNLVQTLFEDGEIGEPLREAYAPLYYAVKILSNQTDDNLLLRIPPDVLPTVESIVAEVKEKQAFYNRGK
jgi:TPR repeat protein